MSTWIVHAEDCLAAMRRMPDASADAVVTDPPYGVDVAEWDAAVPTPEVLAECLRVARGAVVWFGSCVPERQMDVLTMRPERTYIWHNTFTRTTSEGAFWHWQPFYVWRKKHFVGMGSDVVSMAANLRSDTRRNVHRCQKPLPLMNAIVRAACPEGGLVLDPFCGSGTTGVACVLHGRRFVGCEIDQEMAEVARRRLSGTAPLFQADGEAAGDEPAPTIWEVLP